MAPRKIAAKLKDVGKAKSDGSREARARKREEKRKQEAEEEQRRVTRKRKRRDDELRDEDERTGGRQSATSQNDDPTNTERDAPANGSTESLQNVGNGVPETNETRPDSASHTLRLATPQQQTTAAASVPSVLAEERRVDGDGEDASNREQSSTADSGTLEGEIRTPQAVNDWHIILTNGHRFPSTMEWRNLVEVPHKDLASAFEECIDEMTHCYDVLVAADTASEAELRGNVEDFEMLDILVIMLQTAAAQRKLPRLSLSSEQKLTVHACHTQCRELKARENLSKQDFQQKERFQRWIRKNQGEPASSGQVHDSDSEASGDTSEDDYAAPMAAERRKGKGKKKGSISKKNVGNASRKKGNAGNTARGKGRRKATNTLFEGQQLANSDVEDGRNDETASDERPASGPITDECRAKINILRDQITLQIKELADETGKSHDWVESQLFGHVARQRSRNPWNAYVLWWTAKKAQEHTTDAVDQGESMTTDLKRKLTLIASVKYQKLINGKNEKEKAEALKEMFDYYDEYMALAKEKSMNVKTLLKKCCKENHDRNIIWYSESDLHVLGFAVHVDQDGKTQSAAFGGTPLFEDLKTRMGSTLSTFQNELQSFVHTSVAQANGLKDPTKLLKMDYDQIMGRNLSTRDNYQKFTSRFVLSALNQCLGDSVPPVTVVKWTKFGKQLYNLQVRMEGWPNNLTKRRYIPGGSGFVNGHPYNTKHYQCLLRGWELLHDKGLPASEAEKVLLQNPDSICQLRFTPWTDKEKSMADKDPSSVQELALITTVNGIVVLTVGDALSSSSNGKASANISDDEDTSDGEEMLPGLPVAMVQRPIESNNVRPSPSVQAVRTSSARSPASIPLPSLPVVAHRPLPHPHPTTVGTSRAGTDISSLPSRPTKRQKTNAIAGPSNSNNQSKGKDVNSSRPSQHDQISINTSLRPGSVNQDSFVSQDLQQQQFKIMKQQQQQIQMMQQQLQILMNNVQENGLQFSQTAVPVSTLPQSMDAAPTALQNQQDNADSTDDDV